MTLTSIGDMAQSFASRRQSSMLQLQLSRLTQELSSGQATNVAQAVGGSFGQLADIEHQMVVQSSYKSATAEAALLASSMQIALGQVQDALTDVSGVVALAGQSNSPTAISATAEGARGALDAIVAALNTDVAGRPLFAGTALNNAPLLGADAILQEARLAMAGASDAVAVDAALEAFFMDAGGEFETLIYQGGSGYLAPQALGNGETVQLSIRADDASLRAAMKDLAKASLADDPALGLDTDGRLAMLRGASDGMRIQIDAITDIRANLGFAEARIEQSSTRISTELTGLSMARNDLLSVDIFETASKLEDVQRQLETLYTLTARNSRLNLVNFL
ncbi:flagellar biosynthesis protein FlgL [Roseovarius sp. LXJ103]|uniref:flagellin n=1 Tax=Roseovarius carneus TaxID=2853164 RepID=UPI000D614531|nr:flagellin [Roseovarius carneus]MBZ8117557.1 flagellar biosynthesis protein FlgL [Roseovarius carneus]PWE36650.1 flagellar biosynthesis protein FlgL [Pelagicola sp. LXJ1103]